MMSDIYGAVKEHFEVVADVTVNSGRSAQGMKLNGKMFAMFYKGDLLVKLPPKRVAVVIDADEGSPFDPGTGKFMADRVLIPASRQDLWVRFCEESASYARSMS